MPESPSRISLTQQKDINIVEFVDNKILDELNITEIGQSLSDLMAARDRIKLLLDFGNVDHLSSAALGMLINVNDRIRQQNGQLRLANIRPQILEVFRITRLDQKFRILATRADALASFE